jgi:hypothetical protein
LNHDHEEEEMSFDLRIRFTGLMMWVPEGQTAMHVLMPKMVHEHKEGEGEEHEKMPEHFARLVYDLAYEDPAATELKREYQMVDLTNSVLDLANVVSLEGFDVRLTKELANMATVADPVDPALVHGIPDQRMNARVTVRSGVLSDYKLGARYRFESDEPQRITPSTEWTIRRVSDRTTGEVAASLARLVVRGPEGENLLPELHPIGQTIHMEVFHVVSAFLPPHHDERFNPDDGGDTDTHFAAYYALSPSRAPEPRLPEGGGPLPVEVRNRVERDGVHDPGSVCGQTRAMLR